MPEKLLERADVILKRLESTSETHVEAQRKNKIEPAQELSVSEGDVQLSLFAEPAETKESTKAGRKQAKIVSELEKTDLMSLTPMDVMLMVHRWQQELKKG